MSIFKKTLATNIAILVLGAPLARPAEKPFFGPIPVQYVTPGSEIAIDMHRFYQPAAKSDIEFSTSDGVDLAFDRVSFQLHALTRKAGLADVTLKTGNSTSILTLAGSAGPPTHRFVFKPSAPEPGASPSAPTPVKVFVAGSFNGWSTDKTPLAGPNEAGEYTADLPLAPGRYSYKFVVDGKWLRDPANPETEDNGMGDKNSVVTVAAAEATQAPIIFAESVDQGRVVVRAASKTPLIRASAVLEDENGSHVLESKVEGETPEGSKITVALSDKTQTGFVRIIAATADGASSNVVRVALGSKQFRWHDAVMYYAFTDRFADGEKANDKPVDDSHVQPPANFHGGDLRGIIDKIDNGYFESLGANTVWVAPLNRNPARAYQEYPEPHRWYTGYHGYWPVSSTELDPHIGTDKDLRLLVEHAHQRGMKVIADLVLHHVHEEHPWWKQHRDWFGTLDLPNGKKNLRLWDEQQFTTWFEPYLPSFDFSKDAPVRALIDNSVWWLNTYKLDGFRLDAVKHILPSFWWKFRSALRERVDRHGNAPLYLVGETFKDRNGIMQFVGPNMLDGQFDFPLYDQIKDTFALSKGEMKALDDALRQSETVYGKETLMSPLVGNHDKGRFMAYADGDLPDPKIDKEEEVGWQKPPKVDDAENYKKLELAQAFLMSIDGVPMIYYGDEFGMTGAGDPDNRRDMRFGDQLSPDEQHVLENFKKLAAIRKAHPALRYGSRRTLRCDKDVYAFVRAHLNDRVVVVLNRGKTEAAVELNVTPEMGDGDYTDGLTARQTSVRNGHVELTVPAQTAAFISK